MLVCVCVHAHMHVCVCTDTYSDSDGKESACSAGDLGSIPGSRRSSEKGMVTHSSIFVWKIPWTEESGRPQSIGLQRVRYN